jgi:hypothetical protein
MSIDSENTSTPAAEAPGRGASARRKKVKSGNADRYRVASMTPITNRKNMHAAIQMGDQRGFVKNR